MLCKWKNIIKNYKLGILSFVIAFTLGLILFSLVWERYYSVSQIKKHFLVLQNNLNKAGYDLAYENLDFSAFYPFPLLETDNFQIYKQSQDDFVSWKIENLKIKSGIFSPQDICIDVSSPQKLQIENTETPIATDGLNVCLEFDDNGLNNFTVTGHDVRFKDFADVANLSLGGRKIAPQSINQTAAFFDGYLRVGDFKFNGLRKYPLSQNIDNIYVHSVINGKIPQNDDYGLSLNQWLQNDGFIDIKRMVVNWSPLDLVGRGNLYFNEKFAPNLYLQTSPKGFLELLSQLQQYGYIDNKGAFVAKILLNNKSFKLESNDKYPTVITPINWRDGKLSVENITIYSLEQQKTAE